MEVCDPKTHAVEHGLSSENRPSGKPHRLISNPKPEAAKPFWGLGFRVFGLRV